MEHSFVAPCEMLALKSCRHMFFSSSQAVREIAPVLRLRGCFDAIEFFNDSRRSIYPGSEWFNEGRTQADRPDGPSPSGLLSHVVAAPALRSAVTGPFWAALAAVIVSPPVGRNGCSFSLIAWSYQIDACIQ